jgi:hypothetical protein
MCIPISVAVGHGIVNNADHDETGNNSATDAERSLVNGHMICTEVNKPDSMFNNTEPNCVNSQETECVQELVDTAGDTIMTAPHMHMGVMSLVAPPADGDDFMGCDIDAIV